MITEFTCGNNYKAVFNGGEWFLKVENVVLAVIDADGEYLNPTTWFPALTTAHELIEIAVLMNNIKRQHKELSKTHHNPIDY